MVNIDQQFARSHEGAPGDLLCVNCLPTVLRFASPAKCGDAEIARRQGLGSPRLSLATIEGTKIMPNEVKLPKGITLNNPGNLRGYTNMDYNDGYVDGFAKFRSMADGLKAFLSQININYRVHGLRTPDQFVGRYAPATENDTARYVLMLCTMLGINPLKHATADLHLDDEWSALKLAYAVITIEQGYAPTGWSGGMNWVPPSLMIQAMRDTGKWSAK